MYKKIVCFCFIVKETLYCIEFNDHYLNTCSLLSFDNFRFVSENPIRCMFDNNGKMNLYSLL